MTTAIMIVLGLALLIGVALRLHRLFEGESLFRDIRDEWILSGADVRCLDRQLAVRSDRSDLIVSLTSIPSRLPFIATTIASLMRQSRPPAMIMLNLPYQSRREGTAYEIPPELADLSVLRIVRCDDWGPATKLIPTLAACSPDQPIVVVDDDRIYPSNFLATLEAAARDLPDAACGFSGWVVPRDLTDRPTTVWSNLFMRPPAPVRATRLRRRPYPVDILQGMSGFLVRPRFLAPIADYSDAPEAAYFVDDVWISGHCLVPKLVIPSHRLSFQPWRRRRLFHASSLGLLNRGNGNPENRNNTIMIRFLADRWRRG